jgi:hypothetical protein
MSVSLSDTTSDDRRPVAYRLVLDVRRRREKPTDLFRAENNGEAARLADRHNRVGKITALQRDLVRRRFYDPGQAVAWSGVK